MLNSTRCGKVSRPCHPSRPKVSRPEPATTGDLRSGSRRGLETRAERLPGSRRGLETRAERLPARGGVWRPAPSAFPVAAGSGDPRRAPPARVGDPRRPGSRRGLETRRTLPARGGVWRPAPSAFPARGGVWRPAPSTPGSRRGLETRAAPSGSRRGLETRAPRLAAVWRPASTFRLAAGSGDPCRAPSRLAAGSGDPRRAPSRLAAGSGGPAPSAFYATLSNQSPCLPSFLTRPAPGQNWKGWAIDSYTSDPSAGPCRSARHDLIPRPNPIDKPFRRSSD